MSDDETGEPSNKKPRLSESSPFVLIPDGVLRIIFQYLESPDLVICGTVCRIWREWSKARLLLNQSKAVSLQKIPRFECAMEEQSRAIKGDPNMCQLPFEMIERIFTFLGPSDLLNCGKVCRVWYKLAREALRPIFRVLKVQDYKQSRPLCFHRSKGGYVTYREENTTQVLNSFWDILEDVEVTEKVYPLEFLASLQKCIYLKSLTVTPYYIGFHLPTPMAFTLSHHIPTSLERLCLGNITSEESVLVLLSRLPNLRRLELDRITEVGVGLERQLKSMSLLELHFKRGSYYNGRNFKNILRRLSGTLEKLVMPVRCFSEIDSLPNLPCLKHLQLEVCVDADLTEEMLEKILSKTPNLTTLIVDGTHFNLEELATCECIVQCLGKNAVRKISLEFLSTDIQPKTITSILEKFGSSLEELRVPIVVFRVPNLHDLPPVFPKLSQLTISGYDIDVTDEDYSIQLLSLLSSMPNLVKLSLTDLYDNPSFPVKEIFPKVMQICPNITELNLIADDNNLDMDVFRALRNIRRMETNFEKETGLISYCTSLEYLKLHNALDVDVALIVNLLENLKELDISQTDVTGAFIGLISPKCIIERRTASLIIKCPDSCTVDHSLVPDCVVLTGYYN
eukprot:sb/3463031/